MKLAFCEVCLTKVHVHDQYDERTTPTVCSPTCRSILLKFNEVYSDDAIARLPVRSMGLLTFKKDSQEEASKQTPTSPSSEADP